MSMLSRVSRPLKIEMDYLEMIHITTLLANFKSISL